MKTFVEFNHRPHPVGGDVELAPDARVPAETLAAPAATHDGPARAEGERQKSNKSRAKPKRERKSKERSSQTARQSCTATTRAEVR